MVVSTIQYLEQKFNEFLLETSHSNAPKVLCISATKNLATPEFYVPNFRIFDFASCFTLMIQDASILENFSNLFQNKFDHIIIDIEAKFPLLRDLIVITRSLFNTIPISFFHGNDMTSKSVAFQVESITTSSPSNILIYGAGHLGSKIAQLLIESGHNIFLFRRDKDRAQRTAVSINALKSEYCIGKCFYIENIEEPKIIFDGIIGTSNTPSVIQASILNHCSENCFFIDAGLMNFSEDLIAKIYKSNSVLYSTNINISFKSYLQAILESHKASLNPIKSHSNNILLFKAGIVAPHGAFIVDNPTDVKRIFGVANGRGGLLLEQELTNELRDKRNVLKKSINTP